MKLVHMKGTGGVPCTSAARRGPLDVSRETLQKHAASPLHAQDSSARAVAAGSPRSPRRGGPSPAMPPNTTATRARQVSTYSCTSVDNSEEYADLRGRHPHRRAQTV